jgi:hypothetical protein
MNVAEIFDFEDFFVDPEDPGLDIEITLKARTNDGVVERVVPMTIRKGVDLNGSQAAQQKGLKVIYDPETGKPKDIQVNEAEIAAATLAQVILKWPFTKGGKTVPINEKHIKMMFGDNVEAILKQIGNYATAKKAALDFFENQ